MKLQFARLCIDCTTVHDGYICPDCGSRQQFPIAAWLDRDKDRDCDLHVYTAEVIELENIFRLKEA
jgi:rRNA maturation endonuclease Nob1